LLDISRARAPTLWLLEHARQARADFDMLLGSLYLLIEGAGIWSPDAMFAGPSLLRSGRFFVIQERHESKVHVQLLMAVKES
jgi:hypothetical protein